MDEGVGNKMGLLAEGSSFEPNEGEVSRGEGKRAEEGSPTAAAA